MSSVTVDLLGESGHKRKRLPSVSLSTLRWLTVIVPVLFLIGVDYIRHFVFPFFVFHDWPGFVVIWGGNLVAVLGFSHIVFRTVERMQKEILQRNQELSLLHDAAFRQAEQLKALHEAGMALTSELSLETVLQKVVDLSRELVGARYGALAVYDEEKSIERLITSGLAPEERERITAVRTSPGVMASVPDRGKPLRLVDVRQHHLFAGFPPNHPDMQTFLGVPIVSKGQVIGNLRLTNKRDGEEFTQEDEDKVVMLAAQAAIVIQNAKLYAQEQVLAVLEERERIAQDLHDGIIQDIYAIGLSLEQCIEQADGSHQKMSDRLSKAVDGLNKIIKDIRNYIFALEPTDLQGNDLAAGLDNMTREFRINSLVDAEVVVHGEVSKALPHDQVGQVLQIAREALANVLKHARASAVTVEVKRQVDRLELTIADNGNGFDPSRAPGTGHGLRNIAERSKALGGHFDIETGPNKGTRIIVTIPIAVGEGNWL